MRTIEEKLSQVITEIIVESFKDVIVLSCDISQGMQLMTISIFDWPSTTVTSQIMNCTKKKKNKNKQWLLFIFIAEINIFRSHGT